MEHPLCVLSKAEWLGDRRGRSSVWGSQSMGEGRSGMGWGGGWMLALLRDEGGHSVPGG